MSKRIPETLQRELDATFRRVRATWEPEARRHHEQRRTPLTMVKKQRERAADAAAGEATPIDISSWASELMTERNLTVAATALGAGFLIGWWWKRRKAATVSGAKYGPMLRYARLPDWAH